jgi:hypothetical protein
MLVVADNLNTRNVAYMDALSRRDARALAGMVCALREAGAEAVNLQCSLDGAGDEDVLPWAVEAVLLTAGVETGICLDSRNLPALKAALPLPKSPPLVNYVSRTEPPDRKALLEAAAAAGASVVLRASREVPPAGLEAKLQIIEELIEAANAADIPNERLYADPSLVHIGRGAGQSHLANSREFVRVLSELVDPPGQHRRLGLQRLKRHAPGDGPEGGRLLPDLPGGGRPGRGPGGCPGPPGQAGRLSAQGLQGRDRLLPGGVRRPGA